MMLDVKFSFLKLNKLYFRILSTSILALTTLAGGLIPDVAMRSPSQGRDNAYQISTLTISLAKNAYGQEFTPEETENYAKAGYGVELLRREVYQEIKGLMNEPPPSILCDQQSTLDNLQPDVREIADRYCSQSRQIVEQNNLTINRFNELKNHYDRQDDFYQQVQEILLKLQN